MKVSEFLKVKINRQVIGVIVSLSLILSIVALPNISGPILSVIGAWYVGTLIVKCWYAWVGVDYEV